MTEQNKVLGDNIKWRIVKQPDGKYARFSDAIMNFTQGAMTESEAFELCTKLGCSKAEAQARIENADEVKGWKEACKAAREHCGEEEFQIAMTELGIDDNHVSRLLEV